MPESTTCLIYYNHETPTSTCASRTVEYLSDHNNFYVAFIKSLRISRVIKKPAKILAYTQQLKKLGILWRIILRTLNSILEHSTRREVELVYIFSILCFIQLYWQKEIKCTPYTLTAKARSRNIFIQTCNNYSYCTQNYSCRII